MHFKKLLILGILATIFTGCGGKTSVSGGYYFWNEPSRVYVTPPPRSEKPKPPRNIPKPPRAPKPRK